MELHHRKTFEVKNLASVDIFENKDEYTIKYVCRDMVAEDFDVSVHMDMLTVRGNKKDEHRFFFEHEFQLPTYLNGDTARATFGRETLKIRVPKIDEAASPDE